MNTPPPPREVLREGGALLSGFIERNNFPQVAVFLALGALLTAIVSVGFGLRAIDESNDAVVAGGAAAVTRAGGDDDARSPSARALTMLPDARSSLELLPSDTPSGRVSNDPEPFICQTDQGGSIDPSTFVDSDGQRYVLWKNDGNSSGYQVWLHIQKLSADGLTLEGEPLRLLSVDQRWEGNLVEAPTLWQQDGKYYLFYSANAYNDRRYATGYAVADDIFGPYVKEEEPLPPSRKGNLLAPVKTYFRESFSSRYYLWVYAAWAAIVVVVFPPLFGFR